MVQCLPFGPPRVGKTCLYHRLLDKPPPGTPSTCDTPGTGSLSTDVLSERKMIQVKIDIESKKIQAEVIVAEHGKWSEVISLQEEIAIYLKTIEQQLKIETKAVSTDAISSKKISDTLQSTSALSKESEEQNKDKNKSDFPLLNSGKPQMSVSTTLDDAVVRAITDHVSGGKVDMGKVQALLDKSMTIFYTDTGGQPEFHEVLPALVAGPTMFLLVFNLLKSLDSLYRVSYECSSNQYEVYNSSFSVKDVLMQCFSSIVSYHEAQSRDVSKQKSNLHQMAELSPPPTSVLVVGTHSDLVSSSDVLKADKEIKDILGDKAVVEYFTMNKNKLVIPIDNYKDDDGSKVREVIERVVKREKKGISPYKIKIPVHWLGIELYLRQKKCSSVSFSECSELARKFNIDDEELTSCLWFLHYKTGTIRYYSSVDELKDTIITKPNVLFAAVTEFIMSTFTIEHVDKKIYTDFKALGLFNSEEVDFIFNRHKERLGITFIQLMALLSHLNILVPAHDGKFDFFLPCALAHAPESADTESDASHYSLSIIFNKGFVPKGCFSGLLGSLCKEGWRITYADSKPQLYRNKAILLIEHEESDQSIDCTITATVSNIEFSIQYQSDSVFSHIQNIVKRGMQGVCTKLQYDEMWSFGITCKHRDCKNMDSHFASVDKKEKKAICIKSNRRYKLKGTQDYWICSKYNFIIYRTCIIALINDYYIVDALINGCPCTKFLPLNTYMPNSSSSHPTAYSITVCMCFKNQAFIFKLFIVE